MAVACTAKEKHVKSESEQDKGTGHTRTGKHPTYLQKNPTYLNEANSMTKTKYFPAKGRTILTTANIVEFK